MNELQAKRLAKDPATGPAALANLTGIAEGVDRLLAAHPKAGADLLEKLSHSSDKATRKAVVLNANTPKEVLLHLAPQFPGDFFRNPAFDWLVLEDPNLLFNLGQGVLKSILKRPECPESFMNWAAEQGSEAEQLALAMNPKASEPMLRKLQESAFPTVAAAASGHQQLGTALDGVDLDKAFEEGIEALLYRLTPAEARRVLSRKYLGPAQKAKLNAVTRLSLAGYATGALLSIRDDLDEEEVYQLILADRRMADDERVRRRAFKSALLRMLNGTDSEAAAFAAKRPEIPVAVRGAKIRDWLRDWPNVQERTKGQRERPMARALSESLDSDAVPPEVLAQLGQDFLSGDYPMYLPGGYEIVKNSKTPAATVGALESLDGVLSKWIYFRHPGRASERDDQATREQLASSLKELIATSADLDVDIDNLADIVALPDCPPGLPAMALSKARQIAEFSTLEDLCNALEHRRYLAALGLDEILARACSERLVAVVSGAEMDRTTIDACRMAAQFATGDQISAWVRALDAIWFRGKVYPHVVLNILESILASPHCVSDTLVQIGGILKRELPRPDPCHWPRRFWPEARRYRLRAEHLSRHLGGHRHAPDALRKPWLDAISNVLESLDGNLFEIPESKAASACNNKLAVVRLLGLSHPLTRPEVLARRSKSSEWLERMAIARNRNTPPNIIKLLTKDPHRLVARQAEKTKLA